MENRSFSTIFLPICIILCIFVAQSMVQGSFLNNENNMNTFGQIGSPSSHWMGRKLASISKSDRANAERIRNAQADSPRYTFFTSSMKLERINNTFCYPDANGDCQWVKYGESVFLVSSIGFIIGILGLFIIGPIFWIFRACCFGGCKPSSGIFCPGEPFDSEDGEGYKKRHVIILKIVTFCILLLAIVFSILGFVGNAQFGSSINELVNITVDSGNGLVNELEYISQQISILEQAGYTDLNISSSINQGVDQGNKILEQIDSVKGEIKKYNSIRQGVMLGAFLLALILFVIVVVSAIFSVAWLSYFMGTVGFFAMFIMWLSFSIHYPISVVIADVCRALDEAQSDQNGNSTTAYSEQLAMIGKCSEIEAFVSFKELALGAYNESYTAGCDALVDYCNLTLPCYGQSVSSYYYNKTGCAASNCSDFDPSTNCTRGSLPSFLDSDIADYVLGCPDGFNPITQVPTFSGPDRCPWNTSQPCELAGQDIPLYVCKNLTYGPIEVCQNNCLSSESRNISGLLVKGVNGLIAFGNLLEDHILPLLECKQINEAIEKLTDVICIKLENALFYMSLSSGFLGALLVPGIILGILSTKRFNKANLQIYNFD